MKPIGGKYPLHKHHVMMCDPIYDLIIIGAGPAGTAAAIHAANEGKTVLLLDRSAFKTNRPGEHLSGAALESLAQIGWFPEDHRNIAAPVTTLLSSWFGDEVVQKQAIHDPYGLGYSIKRPEFEKSLHDLAIDVGVKFLTKTRFLEMRVGGNIAILKICKNKKNHFVKSRFVLDGSGITRALSKGAHRSVDRMICFHFQAKFNPIDQAPLSLAVEAQKNGWWYSLEKPSPQAGQWQTTVGFFCDTNVFKTSKLDAHSWVKHNLDQTDLIKKRIIKSSIQNLRIYPTGTQINSTTEGNLWKSIGDAAQMFDPLSQQGLLKSLMKDQIDTLSVRNYLAQRDFMYSQAHSHYNQDFWKSRREFLVN